MIRIKNPMSKRRKIIIFEVAVILIFAITAILLCFGVLHINDPKMQGYTVFGVDVSAYQGEIDWSVLSGEGISFAFIKATEGSTFVDSKFSQNFSGAQQTALRIGAYHFFSFESPGKTQAAHYCETVPKTENGLPPVVDVEFYGNFKSSTVNAEEIRAQLRDYVDAVKAFYGKTPIIYTTQSGYKTLIGDNFSDCDFWIRSVYSAAGNDPEWKFWQYSDRHVLSGYVGSEKYIDMNVFCGDAEQFAAYGIK